MSIRTKICGALLVVAVALGATVGYLVVAEQQTQLEGHFLHELNATGRLLQSGTIDPFFNSDRAELRSLVSAALTGDNVTRVWAIDTDGAIVTDGSRSNDQRLQTLVIPGLTADEGGILSHLGVSHVDDPIVVDGSGTLTGVWPVVAGDSHLGSIVVEVSTSRTDAAVAAVRRSTFLVIVLFLVLTCAAVWIITTQVSRQLKLLTEAASSTATTALPGLLDDIDNKRLVGNFRLAQVEFKSSDEIGVLAHAYNAMLGAISDLGNRLVHLLEASEKRFDVSFKASPNWTPQGLF